MMSLALSEPMLAPTLPVPVCLTASDPERHRYQRPLVLYPWHLLEPGESVFFAHPQGYHALRALRTYLYHIRKRGGIARPSNLFAYHHRMVYGIWGLVVTRRKDP